MDDDTPTLRSFLADEPEVRWGVGRPSIILVVGVPIGWLITAGIAWMIATTAAREGTASAVVLVIELLFEGLWTVVAPVFVGTVMLGYELAQLARGRPSWAVGARRFLMIDRRGRALCVRLDRIDYVSLGPMPGRGVPVPRVAFDARARAILGDATRGRRGAVFIAALRERLEAQGWTEVRDRLVPPGSAHELLELAAPVVKAPQEG